MIKFRDLIEASNVALDSKYIISGEEFKRKYITTKSGLLSKTLFDDSADSMGNVMGNADYWSVTFESEEHYANDDYAVDTIYADVVPTAKIWVQDGVSQSDSSVFRQLRKHVDAVYEPNESYGYIGIAVFNTSILKE